MKIGVENSYFLIGTMQLHVRSTLKTSDVLAVKNALKYTVFYTPFAVFCRRHTLTDSGRKRRTLMCLLQCACCSVLVAVRLLQCT